VGRLLEIAGVDLGQLRRHGGESGNLAIGHFPTAFLVHDDARAGRYFGEGNLPLVSGRLHEDPPRLGTDQSSLVPVTWNGGASDREDDAADVWVRIAVNWRRRNGWREYRSYFRPIGIEFLSYNHRQASKDTLAHFRRRCDDGDGAVGADSDPT